MTSNQLKKLADSYGLDLKYVTKWTPPQDDDLRPLIAMPNIPKPLHSVAPRTVLGARVWNLLRKRCYEVANDTCEICGEKPELARRRHAHEVYEIDYEHGTSKFIRAFCVCSLDHLGCIHTGRAITLYAQNNPLYPKEFLLEGAEKAFTIISSFNRDHPEGEPLRAYSTFIEYLKFDELREPMLKLIEKYDIKFYMEDPKKMAKWKDWKLIIGDREYPTPYKNEKEWQKAMEEASKNDTARIYGAKKKKFEGIDSVELSDKDLEKINNTEIPEGF